MTLSNRDQVRLLIGDTDVDPDADALLSDAEIDNFLANRATTIDDVTTYNVPAAAADAAAAIAAQFSRQFSFTEDGQRFEVAQRVGHYQGLEKALRARAGGSSALVTLAGTATTS